MFGSKKIMMGLMAGVLSTTACALDANKDPDVKPDDPTPWVSPFVKIASSYPLWYFCSDHALNSPELNIHEQARYASYQDAVFVGKVIQRKLKFNDSDKYYSNACWVNLKVETAIKGSLDKTVLVKLLFDERTPWKEKLSYKNCYMQSGEKYVVSGSIVSPNRLSKVLPQYILAAKVEGKSSRYLCPPVEKLPEGNALVTEIKNILEKNNDGHTANILHRNRR